MCHSRAVTGKRSCPVCQTVVLLWHNVTNISSKTPRLTPWCFWEIVNIFPAATLTNLEASVQHALLKRDAIMATSDCFPRWGYFFVAWPGTAWCLPQCLCPQQHNTSCPIRPLTVGRQEMKFARLRVYKCAYLLNDYYLNRKEMRLGTWAGRCRVDDMDNMIRRSRSQGRCCPFHDEFIAVGRCLFVSMPSVMRRGMKVDALVSCCVWIC